MSISINGIDRTLDAGSADVKDYAFASQDLAGKFERHGHAAYRLASPEGVATDDDDQELKMHFRLNQTGNVWYATSSPDMKNLEESTRDLFASVSVLFAAMTKAMAQANKNLFDFDDWSNLIKKSGYFVEVGKVQRKIKIDSTTVSVDVQILTQLLQGIEKGAAAMSIARDTLSMLNGEYAGREKREEARLAHLLFICEEILGAASVTVRLFYMDSKQMNLMTKSPCHESTTEKYEQQQRIDTFRFVDPDQIRKYAKKYTDEDPAFMALTKKLQDALSAA